MRHLVIAALIGLASASVCAQPAAAQATASGRPEITLTSVSGDQIRGQLTNDMLNRGYALVNSSANLMVFDRQVTDIAWAALYSTRAGGLPNARVSFTIADMGGSTRVVADIEVVSNPGTAFERRNPVVYGSDRAELEQLLESLRPAQPLPPMKSDVVVRNGQLVHAQDEPAP